MPRAADQVVNSQSYWENRFLTDWQSRSGREQSRFFYAVALKSLPRWLLKGIRDRKLSILDWGCALGDGTDLLATSLQVPVTGVDFSRAAISDASENYSAPTFVCADVLSEERTDLEAHDILFCSNVLEHFPDPWGTLDRLLHLARGAVVVLVPFEEFPRDPEHEITFTTDNVPTSLRDDYTLFCSRVIDTKAISPTYWPGKQLMLLYARPVFIRDLGLSLADLYMPLGDVSEHDVHDADAVTERVERARSEATTAREQAIQAFAELASAREQATQAYALTSVANAKVISRTEEILGLERKLREQAENGGVPQALLLAAHKTEGELRSKLDEIANGLLLVQQQHADAVTYLNRRVVEVLAEGEVAQRDLAVLRAELAATSEALRTAEAQLEEAGRRYSEVVASLSDRDARLSAKDEMLETLKRQGEMEGRDLAVLRAELAATSEALRTAKVELQEAGRQHSEVVASLSDREARISKDAEMLETLKRQMEIAAANEVSEKQERNRANEQAHYAYSVTVDAKQKVAGLLEEISALRATHLQSLDGAQGKVDAALGSASAAREELARSHGSNTRLSEQLIRSQEELIEAEQRAERALEEALSARKASEEAFRNRTSGSKWMKRLRPNLRSAPFDDTPPGQI